MPSMLFAVLLLPFIFDVVLSAGFSFSIQPCNVTGEDTGNQVGDYSYDGIPNVPLCPLSSSPSSRWSYDLSGNASVFSNQSFSSDQICVTTDQNDTKLFFSSSFISSIDGDGVGYIFFLVNGTPLTVRYAPTGIFQIEPLNNTISIVEGQPYLAEFIFLAYFGQSQIAMDPNLYKVLPANGGLSPILSGNGAVNVRSLVDINLYCTIGILSTPRPKAFGVVINNPGVSDFGIYSVIVDISGVNYTTNFTINVSPPVPSTISPSPTTTSSIIMSSSVVSINGSSPTISTTGSTVSTTGSTVSPSVDTTITLSPLPTEEPPSGISLVLYGVLGFLVFVFVVVLIIFLIVIVSCCVRVKSRRVEEPLPSTMQYDEIKLGGGVPLIAESGRTDSNSSTRPLVVTSQLHGSRPSSTSSTPSTTKQEDYTAVYCGERHTHIGSMWEEKYSNKCILLHSDDEILASLENPLCREIFVHADAQDPVVIATMSRGSPRSREKLKWWHIVDHDKTPDHLIEAEGFKIVQVQGDPRKFETLQLGMLKTDLPTFNHTNGALYENHTPNGHTYSNLNASYPEEDNSEKKKLKEEIDGLASNDGGSATDAIRELVQEQRKTNEYLKGIKEFTEQTASNTEEIGKTEKSILAVHEEAQVGINEASV